MDHAQTHPEHGDQHMRQMVQEHQQTLWTHFSVILLGLWLLSSPAILGYQDPGNFGTDIGRLMAERSLPPPEARAEMLTWSDVASGALLVIFGTLSLFYRHRWAQWGTCFTGIWLLFAPLVFWSPDAASYTNDTMVGALAIAFSVLVPMMPGMSMKGMAAPEDIPPGWDYSPSSWSQRLPIIALALVGFFIARYLAAYQLGHIAYVWDPFFGDGTAHIITSDVSKAWPIPDAGLGATSYMLEALSGMMGDRRRWRTMPWMVALFGVLVVPLGGVSIFFIMIQPVMIGTWCTLCLVSALAMVLMLPYTFDELVAMFQFLRRARRDGQTLWQVFWHGGIVPYVGQDRSPPLPVGRWALAALAEQREALPKALVLSTALGVWLMFTRLIFGTEGAMANSDHLVGALVVTFSVSAFSEVARPLRGLNILLGAWLVLVPWVLEGATRLGAAGGVMAGILLIVLALPRGPIRHSYDGWDRHLVW